MADDEAKPAAHIEATPVEQELLASLRNLIGERAGGTGEASQKTALVTKPETKATFSIWQFIFIFALALDLSLIYLYVLDLFPGLEQNSVLPRLAQLLPIVGGTLLVSYLDQIRSWILGLTARKHFGLGCVIVLPLLLAFQMHFYSLVVELHPATAHVRIMEKDQLKDAEFIDSEHHLIRLKKPFAYTIEVENQASVYKVTPLQVLKGTMARWHWIELRPLRLEELHPVTISSPQPKGRLEVTAPDTPAMRISGLERSLLPVLALPRDKQPPDGTPEDMNAAEYVWSHPFKDDDTPSINLPEGTYEFVLTVDGCNKRLPGQKVPVQEGQQIDFLTACVGQ